MSFVHDDDDFPGLLQIVANKRTLAMALIEKDYWVTHTLWALHDQGLDVWFKGGTSLSKGFGLIERFSEDLDLKIEPGRVNAIPAVANWKSDGTKATSARKSYFEALANAVHVPGTSVALDTSGDPRWHGANLRVTYPGRHLEGLPDVLKPFVLLEIGNTRVTPFVRRDMSSWIHEELAEQDQLADFVDNRPKQVRCVHPLVTLFEKLDALMHRFPRSDLAPATFVRHFEDAARIIDACTKLPPLDGYESPRGLVDDLLQQKQIRAIPSSSHEAFRPTESERWDSVRRAHDDIALMFWGQRTSIDVACASIRTWLDSSIG